ncbi:MULTISPECIES: Ycf51 family protein [Prochlorococcus]|uniref:Ycf51 family protein n=1 Tax=Prochlorococcus TaxID=1218 RepID=UPI0005336E6E|nr:MULTISPECIES: Ycf51 family protein [Prochlorococcus]KGG12284.1 hypothetical protein EV05_1494 [Prochlorococcus sp. MIT 0601]
MSTSQLLQQATELLAWSGLGLAAITIISFLIGWNFKFRLVGATVFTLLLSGSCWAFSESYTPPTVVEGAIYTPIVYDNGYDLVVAQASEDFPNESTQVSLEQIAGNLKGGGRNGANVHVRIRKIESLEPGISKPVILGEVIRDIRNQTTVTVDTSTYSKNSLDFSKSDSTRENLLLENNNDDDINVFE